MERSVLEGGTKHSGMRSDCCRHKTRKLFKRNLIGFNAFGGRSFRPGVSLCRARPLRRRGGIHLGDIISSARLQMAFIQLTRPGEIAHAEERPSLPLFCVRAALVPRNHSAGGDALCRAKRYNWSVVFLLAHVTRPWLSRRLRSKVASIAWLGVS